jgi:hypothetical protein
MRSLFSVVVIALCAAVSAAQSTTTTIDPGMTREQVVAKLGEPLSAHSFRSFTYLFYKSGCERTCGMNDLVVLDSGKVVDAVFRSPTRKYSGTSSSPRAIPAAVAAKRGSPSAAGSAPPPPKPVKKPTPSLR